MCCNNIKREKTTTMPRKHIGIIQKGKNAGRLRKGYRFSGRRTKTGLPIIVKVHKKQSKQRGGYDGRGPVDDRDPVEDTEPEDNVSSMPQSTPLLLRQRAVDTRVALDRVRREQRERQRERQRLRAQATVERMRNRRSNLPRAVERN